MNPSLATAFALDHAQQRARVLLEDAAARRTGRRVRSAARGARRAARRR